MSLAETKAALRGQAKQRRDAAAHSCAAQELVAFAGDVFDLSPGPVISSYLAIGSELDPVPLAAALGRAGATIALPVMVDKDAPLVFRAWSPGEPLVARMWGIQEPAVTAAVVEPDAVLVPLLIVDGAGNRLGYGGGFYDRTLNDLRARKSVVAVGVAYPVQRVDEVPHEAYDEPLDYVLTPAGLEKL